MPKVLIVGTEEFEFPVQGENPSYAEQITDWAEAVTNALGTVQQPNDILTTTASVLNNQPSFTNIPAFIFDSSEVISINAEFIITRTTTAPVNNLVESGFIQGNFNGSEWTFTVESINNAGIEFNITPSGQLQYKSTDLAGSSYAGTILFRGKVFNS